MITLEFDENCSEFSKRVENTVGKDENGREFSIREENTVGKGEIASYEQFLLFPQ